MQVNRWVAIAGWALGGLVWLVAATFAGLYLTFPEEAAKRYIVHRFNEANRNEFAMEIGDLSLWRLTGAALEDVQILSLKRGRRDKDNPDPGMEATPFAKLDDLRLRVQVLPRLLGQTAFGYAADLFGGTLEGSFSTSAALTELTLEARSVDLSKVPVRSGETDLKLIGTLRADADLSLNTEELKSSTGQLALRFDGFGLGEGSKAAGFGLPAVTFSKAELVFEAKDGKLVVTSGAFESETITAEVSGDIALNKKIARSRLRLELAFTLPPDLDELAKLSPDLKRARDEEGRYHATCSGTLVAPTCRISRTKGAGGIAGERPGPVAARGAPGLVGGSDNGEPMDEDARRKAREERIKERRERLKKRREELGQRDPDQVGPDGPPQPMPPGEGGRDEPYIPPGEFPTPDELEEMRQERENLPPPPPPDFEPEFPPPDGEE